MQVGIQGARPGNPEAKSTWRPEPGDLDMTKLNVRCFVFYQDLMDV